MTNEHGDKNERAHQNCLIKTEKLLELLLVPRQTQNSSHSRCRSRGTHSGFTAQNKTGDFPAVTIVVTVNFDLLYRSRARTDKINEPFERVHTSYYIDRHGS